MCWRIYRTPLHSTPQIVLQYRRGEVGPVADNSDDSVSLWIAGDGMETFYRNESFKIDIGIYAALEG
jgi:hypothetical protein